MSGNTNKIIAFNYFGGKFSWLENIYKNFPEDFTHLVEVFGGSLAVSLNYNKECIKTANEINSEVTNFFSVLRDQEPELIRLLLLTPCSNQEYDNCWIKTDNNVENARRFYVRVRQSFFGLGCSRKNKGWHFAKQNGDTRGGETVSKWFNALEKLHEVAEVLRNNFQITNCDYKEILIKADFDKAFFYLDPPYSKRSRKSYNDYAFEFSDENHFELASKLSTIKGKAMISGYDCSLMNELYKDWRKVKFPTKKNNIRSGIVQEVIWMNYDEQKKDLFTNI